LGARDYEIHRDAGSALSGFALAIALHVKILKQSGILCKRKDEKRYEKAS
jgi:hypothetical protein